ncbi:MAG: 1-acyl-sn-glycerol-3-phosphate acyltransferase [Alphaproteobacteria bacterium]|jgi:1-acyl-sn-glycerol-3-phosphate acyltransferase|nr:1-acyl-sn-glycerol-3-phosphate acyltransferase [Alphaproteobacteria bacterium]
MIVIRSTIFNIALVLVTLVLGILGLPLVLGPRRWICGLRDFWIRLVLWLLKVTVGLSHRVEGLEHLPKGAFMVASKHQSAWETLALHTIFQDPSIVLKQELLKLPVLGFYISKVGMVPIDRGAGGAALKSMMAAARKASGDGRPVLIFPQGTRVAPGDDAPYHSGVFALYRALNCPVVPVALNSGTFWSRQAFFKRPGVITVRILPTLPRGMDRKTFMHDLETTIETETRAIDAPASA